MLAAFAQTGKDLSVSVDLVFYFGCQGCDFGSNMNTCDAFAVVTADLEDLLAGADIEKYNRITA